MNELVTLEAWEWTALCPKCGDYQFLKENDLEWDGDSTLTIKCDNDECDAEFDITRP